MTATPDIHPDTEPVDDEQEPQLEQPAAVEPVKPRPKPTTPDGHTNVPAPLAGPKRRAALALGLPGAGLAELVAHANFGWPGVLIGTGTALAGAGVAYTVHRRKKQKDAEKTKERTRAGAVSPSGGVVRRLAGRMTRRPGAATASRTGGASGGAPKRSAVGRLLSRATGAGRAAGAGGRAGRASGAGGVAGKRTGRAGVRSALRSIGHGAGRTGQRTAAPGKRTPPGGRTAAKAAQTRHGAGGRGGSIRKLGTSKATGGRRTGSSSGFGRRGGGSRSAGGSRARAGRASGRGTGRSGRTGRVRSALAGHGRRTSGHGRRSSWGHGTSRHSARRAPGHAKAAGAPGTPKRHNPINRHHSRIQWRNHRRELGILGLATGGVLLAPLVAPAVLGAAGVAGAGIAYGTLAAGGYWLATNPRVRYGASTIAGWTKLTFSKAYQWARLQWWKARGKTTKPSSKTPGWTPSWSRNPQADQPAPAPTVVDAEIVPDPPAPKPTPAALPVAARQPQMTRRTQPASPSTAVSIRQENPTVSALDQITEALIGAPAFTPASGPDAERYMESIVNVLQALGTRVSGDLQAIGEHLPQQSESLGSLNSLGEVLGAFAAQAGEQVEHWKQNANWVWNQG